MSKDASKIFFGPADVVLYDSTNGYLHCGYLEEVQLKSKKLTHGIIDGNERQYGLAYNFSAMLQQTNQAVITALKTRRAYRQTIYAVGLNNMFTLSNIFISYGPERSDKGVHNIELEASSEEEDNVSVLQNIIGTDGKFETDGGGGVGSGWSTNGSSTSIAASHLSGGGNEQRVTLASGQYLLYNKIAPFESPRRITVSAYVDNRSAGALSYKIGFILLDSASSVIATKLSGTITLDVSLNERSTYTALVVPDNQVVTVRSIISYLGSSGALGVDNFQTQFGPLTDFADN